MKVNKEVIVRDFFDLVRDQGWTLSDFLARHNLPSVDFEIQEKMYKRCEEILAHISRTSLTKKDLSNNLSLLYILCKGWGGCK